MKIKKRKLVEIPNGLFPKITKTKLKFKFPKTKTDISNQANVQKTYALEQKCS